MPRYDYRCPSCDTVFEVEHGMRERPEVLCPTCGTPAIRQFKTSSIVFKGSGFYNTDQRGKKGSTKATAGSPANEAEASASSVDAAAAEHTDTNDAPKSADSSPKASESTSSPAASAESASE